MLEQALANERADVPAITQRRLLTAAVPRTPRRDPVADARAVLAEARRRAEPFLAPVREAERDLQAATSALRVRQAELSAAPRWRRRSLSRAVADATGVVADARAHLVDAESAAAAHVAAVGRAEADLRVAEREASVDRIRRQLRDIDLSRPGRAIERGIDHGMEIDGPGL